MVEVYLMSNIGKAIQSIIAGDAVDTAVDGLIEEKREKLKRAARLAAAGTLASVGGKAAHDVIKLVRHKAKHGPPPTPELRHLLKKRMLTKTAIAGAAITGAALLARRKKKEQEKKA